MKCNRERKPNEPQSTWQSRDLVINDFQNIRDNEDKILPSKWTVIRVLNNLAIMTINLETHWHY